MAYTRDHLYVTFGGSLPGGEEWQTGARYAPQGAGPSFTGWDLISVADCYTATAALWTALAAFTSTDTYLSWLKIAAIKTDGLYDREPKVYEDTTPNAGGSTYFNALQVAVVASLRSGQTLGRANYGRMYLPIGSLSRTSGSPYFPASQATTIATAVKTWLQAVEGEVSTAGMAYEPAVMSSLGSGTTKPVTRVEVGRVMDTQRRRRNRIPELYEGVSL